MKQHTNRSMEQVKGIRVICQTTRRLSSNFIQVLQPLTFYYHVLVLVAASKCQLLKVEKEIEEQTNCKIKMKVTIRNRKYFKSGDLIDCLTEQYYLLPPTIVRENHSNSDLAV